MAHRPLKLERFRAITRWLIIVFYTVAGISHLMAPGAFLTITPDWVPYPNTVIFLTGLCELAGAIGMAIPATRRFAGIMLALYALLVFPANIKHAMDYVAVNGIGPGLSYHAPRLMLQPVFIWWALFAADIVNWPFPERRR